MSEDVQASKRQQEDSSPVPLEEEANIPTTLPHCPIEAQFNIAKLLCDLSY